MTDHPDQPLHDGGAGTEPTEPLAPEPLASEPVAAEPKPSRWERVRPTGRLGQVAAILVATAAAIFIVAAIFVAGFAVGSEGGGHHHGHGGDGYSHSESEGSHHRDSGRDRSNDNDGPGHN